MKFRFMVYFCLFSSCFYGLVACQASSIPTAPTELARVTSIYAYLTGVNSQTGYAYTANGRGEIGVIDGESNELVAEYEIFQAYPRVIAIDEARDWIYIVNKDGDSVTVLQGKELKEIVPLNATQAEDIAINSHTGWAYIPTFYTRSPEGTFVVQSRLTVLLGTEIIHQVDITDIGLRWVVFEPINQEVYVATDDTIIVFKGIEEIARLEVEKGIRDMAVNPINGDIFVLSSYDEILQFRNKELINSLSITPSNQVPQNMLVHPLTGDIYVTTWKPYQVLVIKDVPDKGLEIVGHVPLTSLPKAMTADPLTGNVYVVNDNDYLAGNIAVINGIEKIAEIPNAGGFILSFGVNAKNGRLYVPDGETVAIWGFTP